MMRRIEAIYERGTIRPLQPLDLPDGTRILVVVIAHDQTDRNPAEVLAAIAALPLEGSSDCFSGREHDSILYPRK